MPVTAGGTPNFGHRVLIIAQKPVPSDPRIWQEATELAKNGYAVSVICPKGKDCAASYEKREDVHIFRHPVALEAKSAAGYMFEYASSLAWEFMFTCKVFFSLGFDAIHACNPPDNIFLIGGFFKMFFNKKFLFDHRTLHPELYEAGFRRRDFLYKIMLWWERLAYKTADVAIAGNDSCREIAVTRGKMPADKVFVVRSGPSLKRIKLRPSIPSLKNGRKYLVGYAGIIGPRQGIHYLAEAVRIIVEGRKRRDIQFALTGDGPGLEILKKRVAIEGLADYMTFTGRVPDERVLDVLSTSDLCVNSDEVTPASGKSMPDNIMEYMALGKPVVQFDTEEGRTLSGDASSYAKPNDAQDLADSILALLGDPEKRKAMGQAGRARVENELAWSFEAPKLLAAYGELFRGSERR